MIFGIGVSRTGGRSLSYALETLGYRTRHWPFLFLNKNLKPKYALFEKYDAIIDMPATLNYQELAKRYPEAKFILTLRDKKPWLNSMNRLHNFQRWFVAFLPHVLSMDKAFWGQVRYDEKKLSQKYDAHVKEVRAFFKGTNRLLELNITKGEGYEKLCPFLNLPVLQENFPHKNKGIAKKMIKKVQKIITRD